LVALDCRGDRGLIRDVELGARRQHVRQPAMCADFRKGLAQRAGRAGDQQRTSGRAILRQSLEAWASMATAGPPPPTGKIEKRMFELLAAAELCSGLGHQGRAGLFRSRVERPDVINTVPA